ncbi:MAG: hypothetical protein QXG46_00370 [Ignisphaera sp.]
MNIVNETPRGILIANAPNGPQLGFTPHSININTGGIYIKLCGISRDISIKEPKKEYSDNTMNNMTDTTSL